MDIFLGFLPCSIDTYFGVCVCFFISISCQYNIVWWLNFVVWSKVSRKPDSFSSAFLPQETLNFFRETFNQVWILGINSTWWWCINSFCIFLDLICLCSVKYFCLFWGMIHLFLAFVPWIIFILWYLYCFLILGLCWPHKKGWELFFPFVWF